ncbi:MAG TPA: serine hydrolase domain-containing protein [Saprospiraceae bacterium]|nr:serine hydrolase domain-containing protein [Saprospiraceae bacterium]
MKRTGYWWLIAFLLTLIISCADEDIVIENEEDFQEFLTEEMDLQNIPALSVLIFQDNNILYESYLGQSNLEQQIDLQDDHMFLLASVSKVITATALMQLYDIGAIELEDEINDYLDFPVNVPGQNVPVTFQMLLTHSSGIADGPSLDDQYYYGEDSPIALGEFLEDYLVPGGQYYDQDENFYDFRPGTVHEYSNVGTALIAYLVEKISGQEFNAYCQSEIFDPLNMSNSFWRLEDALQAGIVAQPYDWDDNENRVIDHYTFTDYPNGGMRSTARDLFQVLKAFVLRGESNGYQLLSSNSIELMTAPQIPAINNEVGLHLFLLDADEELWGHDGGEQGVATIVAFNKETKVGAIVLSNQGEADLEEILLASYQLGILIK